MDGSVGLMMTSGGRSARPNNGKPTRAVWMKPSLRGCVVAAALFALWTAPGAVDAQDLGDQPGLLELLTSDATPEPATETVLPTEAPARNEGEEPEPPSDGDVDYDEGDFPEPTDPTEGETKTPTPTESATSVPTPTTKAPTPTPTEAKTPTPTDPATVVPTPPEPPSPTPTTATPAMRTHPADPTTATVGANISNANASHAHDASVGVSPVLLVGMAAMCAVFLLVWSRRRREGADGGGGGGGADVSAMSGMATTSSTEKSGAEGKKVQYSRIEDRQEEDDEDAEFGGRSGSWDDWENSGGGGGGGGGGGQSHHRIAVLATEEEKEEEDEDYDLEGSRGTAKLTKGLGSSSSSSLTPPSSPPRGSGGFVRTSTAGVKLSSPPPAVFGSLQHDRLKEIVQAETKQQKAPSVASNSSNESFEVVQEQPLDLLSGSLTPPKPQPPASSPEDDLFSQFGMVPTFKKGVQQPPAPVARSSLAAEPLNPFAASPPPSVSASSLFAADLEDVTAGVADASNEWGEEDDDWVQGL